MPAGTGSRPRRVALVATTVAAILLTGIGAVSSSATGTSTGTERTWEYGKVVQHSDGDTPYVDVFGDGTTARKSVRLIDVQATETRHKVRGVWQGKNWCHGPAAARRAHQLMPLGSRVRLRSVHRYNSHDFSGRLGRTVQVRRPDGTYTLNPQVTMLNEGHVMWFPHPSERVHNREYHVLSAKAALRGRHIWNKTYCGAGPQQAAQLKIWVHHDANGGDDKDNAHRNNEYVIVRNNGGAGTLRLGGWHIRDTALYMYRFPAGTTLRAGRELRVHTGKGNNHGRHYYWGMSKSVYGEREMKGSFGLSAHMGDGAFLLDPQGDFRAWTTYPCVLSCGDPTGGNLRISQVVYDIPGGDAGNERVQLTNTGGKALSLSHLQLRSWPWNYVFPTGFTLRAGSSVWVNLKVSRNLPANTGTDLYWFPSNTPVLDDGSDEVDVSTLTGIQIDCFKWGSSATCAH